MNIMHKVVAALGFGLAVSVAQAGNISWSIGINLPPIGTVISNAPVYADGPYYGPAPYSAPPPVVYRPAPVYYSPPQVVYRPVPIYYAPPPVVVYGPVRGYDRPSHRHVHRDWRSREHRWERIDHHEGRHDRGHSRRGRD